MMRTNAVVCLLSVSACLGSAQTGDLAPVISKPVSRTIDLPAEIWPYIIVSLHAKVPGYVERVLVDRGSIVKEGDLLVSLTAPEMDAQIAEADSKFQVTEADRAASRSAVGSRPKHLRANSGGGENAGRRRWQRSDPRRRSRWTRPRRWCDSRQRASAAAQAAVDAEKAMLAYLKIAAPFDGVVTDRLVHPGALVGPGDDRRSAGDPANSRICAWSFPCRRSTSASIVRGANVEFTVPAYPHRNYSGKIARVAEALDRKTRTMPVELDVMNHDGIARSGHVPQREVAGAQPGRGIVGAQNQRGDHHRTDVRDSRPGRPRRVGRREKRRRGWRPGGSDRKSEGRRYGGAARHR